MNVHFVISSYLINIIVALCRPMLPVDPELLARASNTGVVEKPPGMGPVWFPYDPTPPPAGELEFSSRRKKQPSHIQKMCQGIDTK